MISAAALVFALVANKPAPPRCRAIAEEATSFLREGGAALEPGKAYNAIGAAYAELAINFDQCKTDFQFVVLYLKSVKLYIDSAQTHQIYTNPEPAVKRGREAISIVNGSALPKTEKARRVAKLKRLISDLHPSTPESRG